MLGPTESCNETPLEVGGSIDVDIVVRGIPAVAGTDGGIAGTDFNLLFDPAVLQVDKIHMFTGPTILKAVGHSLPISLVDYDFHIPPDSIFEEPPGTKGNVYVDMVDLSPAGEDGDGVLTRVTLQAVGVGASKLDLVQTWSNDDKPLIVNFWSVSYPVDESDATIVVGSGGCNAPTPTTYPHTFATPSQTPSPLMSPTPSPTATVVSTGTSTRSETPMLTPAELPRTGGTGESGPVWPIAVGALIAFSAALSTFAHVRRRTSG